MPAAMDADKGDLLRVYFLQGLAVTDRNEPVFSAMDDVSVTRYFR